MSFCIVGDGDVVDVDAIEIDRALCGECEKPIAWDVMTRTADCCGYRYAKWPSTFSCHRVRVSTAEEAKAAREGK